MHIPATRTYTPVYALTRTRAHGNAYSHTPPPGEPVVPPPRVASEQWRMIHFKYRKTRTMALLIDGFDAPLERTSTMSRIPREGVCVDTEKGQKAVNATLEVGLGNPILEAGFEIICAPTSVEGRLDAIKCALQVCQVELHPFFIYGHDGQSPMTQQVFCSPLPPPLLSSFLPSPLPSSPPLLLLLLLLLLSSPLLFPPLSPPLPSSSSSIFTLMCCVGGYEESQFLVCVVMGEEGCVCIHVVHGQSMC